MDSSDELKALVAAAVAGDRSAMDRLLLREYEPLLRFIRVKLPANLLHRVAPEDALQESLFRATKSIRQFTQGSDDNSFRAWLQAIAQNAIHDFRKSNGAARRDTKRDARVPRVAPDESMVELLDLLPAAKGTPSHFVARQEAIAAIRVALASIPEDYREAIRLRHLEGLSVGEIAARMNRTDRAVHMLCNRGRKALAEAMGSASDFLSWNS